MTGLSRTGVIQQKAGNAESESALEPQAGLVEANPGLLRLSVVDEVR